MTVQQEGDREVSRKLEFYNLDAIVSVASGHSLLELDRESGDRGSRQLHLTGLLRQITGCEDSLVVNNCAGAVFLALTALATVKCYL